MVNYSTLLPVHRPPPAPVMVVYSGIYLAAALYCTLPQRITAFRCCLYIGTETGFSKAVKYSLPLPQAGPDGTGSGPGTVRDRTGRGTERNMKDEPIFLTDKTGNFFV